MAMLETDPLIRMKIFLASASLFLLHVAVTFGATFPEEAPDGSRPQGAPRDPLSAFAAKAAPTPPPKPATSKPPGPDADSDYTFVGFDQLAGYPFNAPERDAKAPPGSPPPDVMAQIPDSIKKMDGKRVAVTGFMLPTKIEKGLATEFLLLNSPLMCCFGVTPATNAWVVVKFPKGVAATQDVLLSFRGRLHVRPEWENGWLASVYQLDGEEPARPRS